MKNLYYLRHGKSIANDQGVWSGATNTPLSLQGIEDANEAGKRAAAGQLIPDLIICSPLDRAAKTAAIIAHYVGYPVDKILTDARIVERSFGELEGTPIIDKLPVWSDYIKLDSIPTVEKLEHVQERAQKFYDDVLKMPQETILVVGHGAFGRALRRVIAGIPYTAEYDKEYNGILNAEIIKLV